MNTPANLPAGIELDTKYYIIGEFNTIARYGFVERAVITVKFFQRDFYGKGMRTYVTTTQRFDLRRPDDTEILYGNEVGGMQSGNPFDVEKYAAMVMERGK